MPKNARPSGADPREGTVASIVRGQELAPPALFHGREAELARLALLQHGMRVGLVFGPAGVGKSALCYRVACDWPQRVIYQRASSEGDLASLLDDLREQLHGGTLDSVEDDEERLRDAVDRLDAQQVLWVLDDLHKLPAGQRSSLVRDLTGVMTKGRLLATSRDVVDVEPTLANWLEIELAGFEHDEAAELWRAFDTLYGEAQGFEDAYKTARGNPLELRIAHARARRGSTRSGSASRPRLLRVEADGRRVLFGDEAIDLSSRPVLRKLWFALCKGAGQRVSKESLAQQVWERDYNPLSDDSPLWVNVGRLRKLLSDLPVAIESDDGGYRLELPPEVHLEIA